MIDQNGKKVKIRYSLLFPPQWAPFNPYLALYTLAGHLQSKGIDIDIYDINLDFYHHILSETYIRRFKDGLVKYWNKLKLKKNREFDEKERIKLKHIDRLMTNNILFDNLEKDVLQSMKVLKNSELFFNPRQLSLAINHLKFYFKILTIPFYPSVLGFNCYIDHRQGRHNMNLKSMLKIIKSKDNFFDEYIQLFLKNNLIDKNYKLFGISINGWSQVIPGLTLAYYLKKRLGNSAHITIGGNYFSRLRDVMKKKQEFFTFFADSIIWGDGEIPLEKLIVALEKGIDLKNVPNMIFYDEKNKTIRETFTQSKLNTLDALGKFDLSKISLKDYLTPEICLPIQYYRGCYWRKCSFCDHFYGPNLTSKSIDRLIEEIKIAISCGINKFVFVDEMLPPGFVKSFSERLLKDEIKIEWFCYGRTENSFNKSDVFKTAYQAGLRMVMWGIESGNQRIMELINKGVDFNQRFESLKKADKEGIWNLAFVFFGFPTETIDEAFDTIKTITNPKCYIDSYVQSRFDLGKYSKIAQNPKKYGIKKILKKNSELTTHFDYKMESTTKIKPTTNKLENLYELEKLCANYYLIENKNQPPLSLKLQLINRDILFLYLCKYGKQRIKSWYFKDMNNFNSLSHPPELFLR